MHRNKPAQFIPHTYYSNAHKQIASPLMHGVHGTHRDTQAQLERLLHCSRVMLLDFTAQGFRNTGIGGNICAAELVAGFKNIGQLCNLFLFLHTDIHTHTYSDTLSSSSLLSFLPDNQAECTHSKEACKDTCIVRTCKDRMRWCRMKCRLWDELWKRFLLLLRQPHGCHSLRIPSPLQTHTQRHALYTHTCRKISRAEGQEEKRWREEIQSDINVRILSFRHHNGYFRGHQRSPEVVNLVAADEIHTQWTGQLQTAGAEAVTVAVGGHGDCCHG